MQSSVQLKDRNFADSLMEVMFHRVDKTREMPNDKISSKREK